MDSDVPSLRNLLGETMPDYTNWAIANQAVMNPATTAADLTQIANAQPSLRAAVAAHPAAHPALLDWLAHQGDPAVAAAVAARSQGAGQPSAPAPGFAPSPGFAPAPTPGFAPAPGYAPPSGAGGSGGMSRNMMVGLIVGGVALIVAIALILVFAVFLPRSNNGGSADFDSAQANYTQAQTALASALSNAKYVVQRTVETQLDNPSLLKKLQSTITTAEGYSPVELKQASGKSAVKAQVAQLQAETSTVNTLKSNLDSDAKAVEASQLSWAKKTLSDAIAEAKSTYDKWQGEASAEALANLQAAIDAAQATLDGLDKVTPADVPGAALDAVSAMLEAELALYGTGPETPSCNVPTGVDPMVCGGEPPGTVMIPMTYWGGGDIGTQMFMSPAGDVGCMNFPDRVECDASGATWQMPAPLLQSQACVESQNCGSPAVALTNDGSVGAWPRSDVPDYAAAQGEGVRVPVLAAGQTTAFGSVACLAEVSGVTCWDTNTHHGFKISSSSLLYW